ncbi:ciliary microtubule-associated protein 3 [Eucyclogobius newberryi]|uniref:ciliary microtubule-associated protein 3 n=1 Tax=Eucyclogobius newberryi TaxID=166745 RepID=UPI003B5BEA59
MTQPRNRLAVAYAREPAPAVGPGSYESQYGTIVYKLEKIPTSRKGFGFSARFEGRFPPVKVRAPSPLHYQLDHSLSKITPPGKTPFNSTVPRNMGFNHTAQHPGPGSYNESEMKTNRKVSWPMRFGGPDWARVPKLDQRALRVKLPTEEEFVKHRSRLAYLSLYY